MVVVAKLSTQMKIMTVPAVPEVSEGVGGKCHTLGGIALPGARDQNQ